MGEILPDGTVQGWTCGCGESVGFQGHDCEWQKEQKEQRETWRLRQIEEEWDRAEAEYLEQK